MILQEGGDFNKAAQVPYEGHSRHPATPPHSQQQPLHPHPIGFNMFQPL